MPDNYLQRFAFAFASITLAACFAGCGAKAEPVVAETKKFRPVDDSALATASASTETSATATDAPAGPSGGTRNAQSAPEKARPGSAATSRSPGSMPGETSLPINGELASI